MAFVRKRKTGKSLMFGMDIGKPTYSTALVESYRDEQGRPRQRVLASMHGEETTLGALAKLAAMRAKLREEKTGLEKEQAKFKPVYESWMMAAGTGQIITKKDRSSCEKVVAAHNKMQKRANEIETKLAKINREGAVIKKHCEATSDEIQAAIQAYEEEVKKAEGLMMFSEFSRRDGKRAHRRLVT